MAKGARVAQSPRPRPRRCQTESGGDEGGGRSRHELARFVVLTDCSHYVPVLFARGDEGGVRDVADARSPRVAAARPPAAARAPDARGDHRRPTPGPFRGRRAAQERDAFPRRSRNEADKELQNDIVGEPRDIMRRLKARGPAAAAAAAARQRQPRRPPRGGDGVLARRRARGGRGPGERRARRDLRRRVRGARGARALAQGRLDRLRRLTTRGRP